jgi:hypothetical protein
MDSPSNLQRKHWLTMMTCLFLKLSRIRIFLKDTNQTKKAALEGALVRQMLFQEKERLSLYAIVL